MALLTKIEAFHLQTPLGFRFCVLRRPAGGDRSCGTIIHVPAFAEELNKSRRMIALAADAWAQDGWTVLQIDLGGCGDSEGDLADARWDGWLDDVRCAHQWAQGHGQGPVWLWGLRLGALLASEAAERFGLDCGLLLWQPVTSGKQHLHQFLRLWTGAQIVGKAGVAEETSPLKRLARGEPVEVAGYEIAPGLAQGLEAAQFRVTGTSKGVHWFHVSPTGAMPSSPVLERLQTEWQAAGVGLQVHSAVGPSFWQTQEIELAPDLLMQSRQALRRKPGVSL